MTSLDLDFVRAQFPALETPWALFDNAGGSVPARSVIERIADYMSSVQVQHGASYALSVEAGERVAAGRDLAARLVGADPGEVVLGASSTVLVRLLAQALRPLLSEGDEVVVTNLDHETNIGPWRALEASGIVVREWRFRDETLELHAEDLDPLLNGKTRLVAFTHCSNLIGSVHDVRAIASKIRAAGALSCVDGVAYAPHRQVDVRELGVDLYFLSLYKTYGPHLGMLYGRRELLERMRGQSHPFVSEDSVPAKYEPGNVSHELAAGIQGVADYFEAVDARHTSGERPPETQIGRCYQLFEEQESLLAQPLLTFLKERPGVRLLGRSAAGVDRVPTISFVVDGRDSSEIPTALDEHKVAIRYGHFYAERAVRDLGLMEQNGVVRISMVHYNTEKEVERLLRELDRVL